MTSVIYVDLSTDSEDETPPDRKRSRLDTSGMAATSKPKGSTTKVLVKPKTIVTSAMLVTSSRLTTPTTTTVMSPTPIKSVIIPSAITVTKQSRNNTPTAAVSNGNSKQIKVAVAQKTPWSMISKTPAKSEPISTAPNQTVRVTPVVKTTPPPKPLLSQKPSLVQKAANNQQKPPKLLALLKANAQQKQSTQVTLSNSSSPAAAKLMTANKTTYTAKLPTMPVTNQTAVRKQVAAGTTIKPVTPPIATTRATIMPIITTVHSMAASATPPLRLLATPPHCAAALNEPLLLNLPPTTSITPQLTPTSTPPPTTAAQQPHQNRCATQKLINSFPAASISPVLKLTPEAARKRVQPITVLKKSDEAWRKHKSHSQQEQQEQVQQKQSQQQQQSPKTICTPSKSEPQPAVVLVESPPTTPPTDKAEHEVIKAATLAPQPQQANDATKSKTDSPTPREPLVPEYAALLRLSRELDRSKDMERLIDIKLMKYYYSVHESFVRSRGFRKLIQLAMERIRAEPEMIYIHLKGVIEELKVRRKAKAVVVEEADEPAKVVKLPVTPTTVATPTSAATSALVSTGNKRTDERIRKLNRTMYTITKRIEALEQSEVDWNDDEDSSYLQVERYKRRACQIYEKICDLTGESKNAHRQLKQPILFKDTPYPQFNRTLTAFVNRMHEFPDFHDVLQLLEHCNKDKNLGLATFEMKRIAHDAFVKVGRLLQARRKTDLYETVTHFTANAKDPAATDPELLAKLNENNKKQTKISDILQKFAREQELTAEEQREARHMKQQQQQQQTVTLKENAGSENDNTPSTSVQAAQSTSNGLQNDADTDTEEEEDDEEEEEEDDDDVDAFVDNFKVNGDVSDADSDNEVADTNAPKTTLAADDAVKTINNNETRVKTVDSISSADALLNGKLQSASSTSNILKIMSVSSLNATVTTTIATTASQQQPATTMAKAAAIADQIVISDEES